jgi:catechol 2,3-dioxygenase-like lactoylglutathione lyase family enzyme
MSDGVKTNHIAILYSDRKKAETFFIKILGLKFNKTFTLSKELSNNIFNINEEVSVDVYRNNDSYFEVFITKLRTEHSYEHICIEVDDKEKFVKTCKKYKIKPKYVKKSDKYLLFIRDFSGNLYEIKEK